MQTHTHFHSQSFSVLINIPVRQVEAHLHCLFIVRSCKGFMHMKFTQSPDGRYVLGENSPPFSTIPEVITYYTTHKLPIRGAEHMSLLYPVPVQTLWRWHTNPDFHGATEYILIYIYILSIYLFLSVSYMLWHCHSTCTACKRLDHLVPSFLFLL